MNSDIENESRHYDIHNNDQHFFASCAFGWGVGHDPVTAINNAKAYAGRDKKNLHVVLYHVPLPYEAHYKIDMFAPVVEGITKIFEGKC